MSVTVDTSEVRTFARDLGRIEPELIEKADDALHDLAWMVTEVAAAQAAGTRWAKVGRSWTAERHYRLGQIGYEVGPDRDKSRSASLIGAYLGWPNGGGGSLDLDFIVERGERPMLDALGDALDRALGAAL